MRRLALGTVQFGLDYGIANSHGQVPVSLIHDMLDVASHAGIDTLDTAIAYGESELCLGQAGVDNFRVVTKLPAAPADCADVGAWVREQLAGSLNRLNVQRVYGLLLHRPDQLLEVFGERLYAALNELKHEGTVEKIGISIYSPDELPRLLQDYQVDIVQAPFNIIDRRLHTSGWLSRLHGAGVEIHARSCFLQGLLLMPVSAVPEKFSRWSDLLTRWYRWLNEQDVSALEACLSFSLSHREIDRVVVGADNMAQLMEIVKIANRPWCPVFPELSSEDEELINPAKWTNL